MNRRGFLVMSACAAGAMLLPLDSLLAGVRNPARAVPHGPRRRILYGSAGTACAQPLNAMAHPKFVPWQDVGSLDVG